jgi:GT2 family glycosyltransferase
MSIHSNEKIAASVITYNRKQLLGECLDALLNQTYSLDAIYIIDNASTDGTAEYLVDKGFIYKPLYPGKKPLTEVRKIQLPPFPDKTIEIYYIRMHENTGGAGGFQEGVKRSYVSGFDWIWLMDDDAEPKSNCLKILLKEIYRNKFMAVCPLILGISPTGEEEIQFYHHKFIRKSLFLREKWLKWTDDVLNKGTVRLDANTFVGPLIHRNVISGIGFPDKAYFIVADDTEYTYRISKKYSLYLIPEAVIKHKDENVLTKFGRIPLSIYWKQYYRIRNIIYFESKYNSRFTAFLMGLYIITRKSLGIILHKEQKKVYRLKIVFRGVIDGLKGRMGRNEKMLPHKE